MDICTLKKEFVMSKAQRKTEEIIQRVKEGQPIDAIKASVAATEDEWHQFSSKAYAICLEKEKGMRKEDEVKPNVATTTVKEIAHILELNTVLAEHALLLPVFSTAADFEKIKKLVTALPATETALVEAIGFLAIQPRLRVLQKLGRLEQFEPFKTAAKFVDAATLSFYRGNYIGSFMTLAPVIEGILIRWMGYSGEVEKPEFKEIRKFFKHPYRRQPCPHNILFHDIFSKACNKIINEHFYKPTMQGGAHARFNRHFASHLLGDAAFATKENCIRLFILLDALSEIYLYELRRPDPRFRLDKADLSDQIQLFSDALIEGFQNTPERKILGIIS
jgi:hypothetical protein